jgi:hypothetical protein
MRKTVLIALPIALVMFLSGTFLQAIAVHSGGVLFILGIALSPGWWFAGYVDPNGTPIFFVLVVLIHLAYCYACVALIRRWRTNNSIKSDAARPRTLG